MSPTLALIVLVLLIAGPLAAAPLERNIEFYFLAIGVLAIVLARRLSWALACDAARAPVGIAIAVAVSGVIFGATRRRLDRLFVRLESMAPRSVLSGLAVFVIALLSGVITAVVAAMLLVETVNLMRLPEPARVRVTVFGCYAIGLASALTPLGGPLAALAARAMGLPFIGLFALLGPYVLPGIVLCALAAGYSARGWLLERGALVHVRERWLDVVLQTVKIYAFVAGLVLVGEALAPFAESYVSRVSSPALFWMNSISAALDNATLVALEVHKMSAERARMALIALLVSGGMLIPGNVPNIICAGLLKIGSSAWARVAIPLGLVMMSGYFLMLIGRA
jgi:predicted cation transporter